MNTYQTFVFEDYRFDPASKTLELHYSLDGRLNFIEKYHFDFDFVGYDAAALDRACQALFFMAGASYYKTYIPPQVVIKRGQLDPPGASFFSKTYQRGMGEFWYVNRLDPRTPINFPSNIDKLPVTEFTAANGLLIGIGGGKDSLVSTELLRGHIDNLATWSVNHRQPLTPLIEHIGLPHYWVEREWDPQLTTLNQTPGVLNGHIPISALWACIGMVVAVLSGRRDIVTSNEQSANEPTLEYQGVLINHQYSKSAEFEQDFQQFMKHSVGESLRYYSFLRPFSELRIAELFEHIGFQKYKDVFSSCNHSFIHGSDRMIWDGTCAKCAFVFLVLTPFVSRVALETLFSGKNLLLDPALQPTYRQLLGIEGDKPLNCVGEIKESRAAMRLAQRQYSDLDVYQFELPEDYDFRAPGPQSMPDEIARFLPVSGLPE